jgi:NADH:ubiquinone oxidoreductase subunit H
MTPGIQTALFYFGRLLQALAMWVLLVDVFMAGPMGPQPNPFYVGIAMFFVGWLLVRSQAKAP